MLNTIGVRSGIYQNEQLAPYCIQECHSFSIVKNTVQRFKDPATTLLWVQITYITMMLYPQAWNLTSRALAMLFERLVFRSVGLSLYTCNFIVR